MSPNCHRIPGVRDSKTLSAAQRERLAPIIRRRAVAVGLGAASVADIDRLNIYHATHLAMRRAIARLGGHDHVLVDGLRIADFEAQVGPYTAIVDGDARVYSIACASVIAKTVRDRMMHNLARSLPGVRLGSQRRLRHPRAPRRHPCPRAHAAPPPELAGDPGAARRGPARAVRPTRRLAGRDSRVSSDDADGASHAPRPAPGSCERSGATAPRSDDRRHGVPGRPHPARPGPPRSA